MFSFGAIFRIINFRLNYAPNIREKFIEFDISDLIRFELNYSLSGIDLPANIMIMTAIKNLSRKHSISGIIFPSEFQPMERAILAGTKNNAPGIGFQHSTMSSNTLFYQFAKDELLHAYKSNHDEKSIPLPQLFLKYACATYYCNRWGRKR